MAILDKFGEMNKKIQRATTFKKLAGKLSIKVCFDRKNPTVKIYDNTSCVELNDKELVALLEWLTEPS